MSFETTELRNNTAWQLHRMRDRIQLNPDYQRSSDIWTQEKRQLLIDTILNGFDMPKLYLHKFSQPLRKGGKIYDFAIIDGKQRLETIWNFIDGNIALASDFEYFKDSSVDAKSMTYAELGENYPELKADFDGFPLAVMCIETNDIEMIEEMFSRLNEAMPLTGAEKRNAYGGPIPVAVRRLAKEKFFTQSLPFPNKRYRHFDLATKFILSEYSGKVVDTKKVYLDAFVKRYSAKPRNKTFDFVRRAQKNVSQMAKIFTSGDYLLRQVGMVILYYHLFRLADDMGLSVKTPRKKFVEFDKAREENRSMAEKDIEKADYDMLEFDRLAQSPNDGYALKLRLRVMLEKVFNHKVKSDDL